MASPSLQEAAQQGDTAAPNPDEVVQLHFIVFVHKDGSLYELDGRKTSPINHGATSSESLLVGSLLASPGRSDLNVFECSSASSMFSGVPPPHDWNHWAMACSVHSCIQICAIDME